MSMTTGDELGKSDVLVKLAVMLFPLAEEAVRQGMTMKEFERGRLGGLLCTGKRVVDQFLIAVGNGDLGETIAHPDDSSDCETTESRKICRSAKMAARMLRTVFGEHEFSAYVYREGEDRRSPIVRRPVDEQLGISPDRPVPQHKRLMAKLPGVIEDLGDEIVRGSILALSWAAREVRQRRKKNQLLVRLMDGQHSLWSDADACLSDCSSDDVIDILDIVHVAGYVGKAAKVLVEEKAAQEQFIRNRLLRILKGDVHGVVRGLRRMATAQKLPKEKRADVDTTCGYFTAHADRMKYDEYLAAGLPIATGVIEGACRHLVKDRLERTGMRWSATGAQAMLSLRCLKASDAWDDFQKQFLNTTPLHA